MLVYIFRHAEAIEATETVCDEWRYLTEKGRKATEGVAKRLVRQGLKSCLILSSPLVRAVQTAQIVAEMLGRKCTLEINGLLQPEGDISELIEFLYGHADAKNIMMVGHEPHLGSFVATLLKRDDTILLKKGSCVIVEINTDKTKKPVKFRSYLTPRQKTITSLKKAFIAP